MLSSSAQPRDRCCRQHFDVVDFVVDRNRIGKHGAADAQCRACPRSRSPPHPPRPQLPARCMRDDAADGYARTEIEIGSCHLTRADYRPECGRAATCEPVFSDGRSTANIAGAPDALRNFTSAPNSSYDPQNQRPSACDWSGATSSIRAFPPERLREQSRKRLPWIAPARHSRRTPAPCPSARWPVRRRPATISLCVVNSSGEAPASMVISPEKSPLPAMCAETSHLPANFGARARARQDAHSGVCNG